MLAWKKTDTGSATLPMALEGGTVVPQTLSLGMALWSSIILSHLVTGCAGRAEAVMDYMINVAFSETWLACVTINQFYCDHCLSRTGVLGEQKADEVIYW